MTVSLTATQRLASDPACSVWLSAHAGTGKTKVLVDRMLRLLLAGEPPSGIMAITYTKAAAAEMQLRLRNALRAWAQMSEEALCLSLSSLTDSKPDAVMLARARGLFVTLMEASPPLQMQTIHGFCQSLLSRFPLEAGLSASPVVMDEHEHLSLLAEAKHVLFANLSHSGDALLEDAVRLVMQQLGDGGVSNVLNGLVEHNRILFLLFSMQGGMEHYEHTLRKGLQLVPEDALPELLDESALRAAESALRLGAKTDIALAECIGRWCESAKNAPGFDAYASGYLTAQAEPRKTLFTKATEANFPDIAEQLRTEQAAIYAHKQQRLNQQVYDLSYAVGQLGQALLAIYAGLKIERNLLDFNDLIHLSLALLSQSGKCEWVLSKLDWQLKHLLLDEAQDTSPQQWALIRLITQELYLPELYEGSPRTLFVVGDHKQSIYRFQGADPQGFTDHADYYEQWFIDSGQPFERLSLAQSFRSTQAVLALVDSVCALPTLQAALFEGNAEHHVHRTNQPGAVRLWPLYEHRKPEVVPPWEVEAPRYDAASASQCLAKDIAKDIAYKIKHHQAEAGDVLILVQRRTAFVTQLSAALLSEGVAVAGADRLRLQHHIASKDVMVLCDWCLFSRDDLALATVLKGPLFAMSEPTLFALAHGRVGSLWEALQASEHNQIVDLLRAIVAKAHELRPYEWLCYVLDECGLRAALIHEIGPEVADVLGELKEQALLFEASHIADLQLFAHWFSGLETDIKRDMEQGAGAVRIMTVHGAKGLQAPIVYLPDTVRIPQSRETLLCDSHTAIPALYALAQGMTSPAVIRQMKERVREDELAEYGRLLYVALTRAENELIICGYETGKAAAQHCWHRLCEQALLDLGCQADKKGIYCYSSGEDALKVAKVPDDALVLTELSSPNREPSQLPSTAILSPSELIAYAHEPQLSDGLGRTRGDVIHALLQLVPRDIEQAQAMLREVAPDWTDDSVVDEVFEVFRQHASFFEVGSRAEVMLQGPVIWQGKRVYLRGQIDRLIERDQRFIILDYKSNREPPDTMPEAYLAQLAAYRAMLAPLTDKPIEAALLWTATCELMWAPPDVMERLCQPAPVSLDVPAT